MPPAVPGSLGAPVVAAAARARGPAAPPRSGWVKRYWPDRVCDAAGCTTRLSTYNPESFCWTHQQPHPLPGHALRP